MAAIVEVHFPVSENAGQPCNGHLLRSARSPRPQEKPSTSELIDWLKLLLNADMPLEVLQNRDVGKAIPPLHGALLKNEQDVMLFEKLAFMARRQGS